MSLPAVRITCHVVARRAHHLLDDEAHETHPVFEAAAKFVATMVGVRRQKLTDEVAMSRMDFHAVEASFASQIDGLTEIKYQQPRQAYSRR